MPLEVYFSKHATIHPQRTHQTTDSVVGSVLIAVRAMVLPSAGLHLGCSYFIVFLKDPSRIPSRERISEAEGIEASARDARSGILRSAVTVPPSAHAEVGSQWHRALEILAEMQRQALKPSARDVFVISP